MKFRDVGLPLFKASKACTYSININIYICSSFWCHAFKHKNTYIHTLKHTYTHMTLRDFGWSLFESLEKYSKLPGTGGYTAIADVTVETENKESSTHNRLDRMDSFLLSETFKYLYCKSHTCIHIQSVHEYFQRGHL
jgi:hypothetical protein